MKIKISNDIRISEPDSKIIRWCKENLVLDNPDFYKLERMGKWTGRTPRTLTLYSKVGDELILPFGTLNDVWSMYPDSSLYEVEIFDLRPVNYDSHINLYDYQKNAVQAALSKKNGILVMPCGSGKTQSGLEIISRIGGRALWLTHTQDLLNQSKKRAESVLGYSGSGTITAGKVNIGKGITFATVQTMSKIDLSQYRDVWDVIIVDECHHAISAPTRITQFGKVISSLSARYKIGLTATPKRADGLEAAMFALLGNIIHEVSREAVAHTTCPIKVRTVHTEWMPDYGCVLMGDGTIDYSKVIDAMIHDEERYKLVLANVAQLDGATMVLANRVEYLQQMCVSLGHFGKKCVCLSGKGQSKKAKAERKQALEALNNGELDCVFCTYLLAAEGLDAPNLRYVVFVTPEKNERVVIQAVGRVSRKADGKKHGTVIDFVDEFGMYKGWWKKRLSAYKKIGCDIIE